MNKLNIILGATLAVAFSMQSLAATPAVDARQHRQQARIHQGQHQGSLTAAETARLQAQQSRLRRHEYRVKSDGVVTAGERYRLHQHQDAASANIHRQKHDAQQRKH